ncbi:MAG: UvrD-helicase domain-containing protein [Acidobacteriota bacterium]
MRKAFEYLENGMWESALRIRKLTGISRKTVLEGRVSRTERVLLTLGRGRSPDGETELLVYVWCVVPHEAVGQRARAIVPEDAPFLSFTDCTVEQVQQVELDRLDASCFTQESIEERSAQETGSQRWFLLDDTQWKRLLLYSGGDLDLSLYLTNEQVELLDRNPPLLISGTAGSGKTTLSVYYLLRSSLLGRPRLLLTYNRHLRDFSERLYRSLAAHSGRDDSSPPDFLTFRDLCLRLVPGADSRFIPNREVDFPSFRVLYAKHPLSEKYDAALVWEEIRSIVKGAKPHLDPARLLKLVDMHERMQDGREDTNDLREEILAIRNTSVFEKADSVIRRVAGVSSGDLCLNLEKHLRRNRAAVLKALRSVATQMKSHEANFAAPLMTLLEYEQLGRKRAPVFQHDRSDIYAVAQWYQARLAAAGLWDEIDMARAAIRTIDAGATGRPHYDLVCCDEVQDFTDIQLSLIVRLPHHPRGLVLAGDPKQIVNPSGFRWEEVKQLFYDRGEPVPPVNYLTLNFRCVGSIVSLANAFLRVKQNLLGVQSDERMDEWKYQGRPPCLLHGIEEDTFLGRLRVTAADQTILTRTDAERDRLKERLGTELVFTIREAKGLEFRAVTLWKFSSEAGVADLWAKIQSAQTARIHDQHIRHEINLLYVGITRAQQDLIVYDGPKPSSVWSLNEIGDLVYRTSTLDVLDLSWRTTSSPEDWKRQADYFVDHEHYRAAAECYRNAGQPELMHRAMATAHEKSREFSAAAAGWETIGEHRRAAEAYELAGEPAKALAIWQRLREKQRALLCRIRLLEKGNRYEELAELWEEQKNLDRAIECWKKAGRPGRMAVLCERRKMYEEAAGAYEQAKDLGKAAALYLRTKRLEDAGRCYEAAGLYAEAARIWKKLRRDDALLRCLLQMSDFQGVGDYYERRRSWREAIEHYRKGLNPALRDRFEQELQMAPKSGADHARRALRLAVLDRVSEAAVEWEAAGVWALAAETYRTAGDMDKAADAYLRGGLYKDAALAYAHSVADRRNGHPVLSTCCHVWRVQEKAGGERASLEAFAKSMRTTRLYLAASVAYEQAMQLAEAASCAVLAGNSARAIRCWMQLGDYQSLIKHCRETGTYEAAAAQLSSALEDRRAGTAAQRRIADELSTLFRAWFAADRSAETLGLVERLVEPHRNLFPLDFLVELWEQLGVYDRALTTCREAAQYWSKTGRQQWSRDANMRGRRLEAAGRTEAAGLWYLCGDWTVDAQRCWVHLEPTVNNKACLISIGQGDRAAEWLMKEGKTAEAARVYRAIGDLEHAVSALVKSGDLPTAAYLLELEKRYEHAYRLYSEAGLKEEAARMLERLKRYEEAAELYRSVGNMRKYQSCRKRVSRFRQLPLDAW